MEKTLSEEVRDLKSKLIPVYGEGEATAIIRLIFYHLKGWSTTDMVINSETRLTPYVMEEIGKILDRLKKHEPIQYITGDAYFYGMDFKVRPGVLIPRPETEELVDMIVKENTESDLRVLDIGSGSGAIAIALARNLNFPEVTAIDISQEAIRLGKENAADLRAKVKFEREDIFSYDPPRGSLDIIVSNPPYIAESEKDSMEANVLDYEPAEALFVPDSDPLIFYKRIAKVAYLALRPGGKLYFEINPLYASVLADHLRNDGFEDVEIILDMHGKRRFAKARRR